MLKKCCGKCTKPVAAGIPCFCLVKISTKSSLTLVLDSVIQMISTKCLYAQQQLRVGTRQKEWGFREPKWTSAVIASAQPAVTPCGRCKLFKYPAPKHWHMYMVGKPRPLGDPQSAFPTQMSVLELHNTFLTRERFCKDPMLGQEERKHSFTKEP